MKNPTRIPKIPSRSQRILSKFHRILKDPKRRRKRFQKFYRNPQESHQNPEKILINPTKIPKNPPRIPKHPPPKRPNPNKLLKKSFKNPSRISNNAQPRTNQTHPPLLLPSFRFYLSQGSHYDGFIYKRAGFPQRRSTLMATSSQKTLQQRRSLL